VTVFGFIHEAAPRVRVEDLLTEDHPNRGYPAQHRVRFSAWMRALVFVGVLFVAMFLYLSIYFAVTEVNPAYSLSAGFGSELVAAIAAYIVLAFVMEARVWPYELRPRRALGIVKGMALGAVLVGVCVAILWIAGSYSITGFNPDYSPWMDLFTLGVTAGFAEEIMMRGTLFRLTEEGLGTWGAVAVSAVIFGGMHMANADATLWGALAIAIEAGILFAAVYVVTRSLWWCIGLHFAWNVAEGPIFGSIVSGSGAQNSWLTSTWTGPDILSGGVFGLEASIVPVILLGGLGVALLVYAWRKNLMVSPIWVRKKALTQ